MSYSEVKKRMKRKKATLHPCKVKRKDRRLKVVKKFVQVKCPPPEVNISNPTVVGPTGPQGIQGVQGLQGIPGKQGVEGPPSSRTSRRATWTTRTSGTARSCWSGRRSRSGGTCWPRGSTGDSGRSRGCRTTRSAG